MQIRETSLRGAYLVELEPHVDDRGFFARTFCEREFREHGLPTNWPQCNLSRNTRAGTLRGMHYNVEPYQEAKLVRCVAGAIWDAIVDLRSSSPTCRHWFGVELSAMQGTALFIPGGFAHGFVTLRDESDVFYHMGGAFQADAARGFRWNDPKFAIDWPVVPTVISARDRGYPDFDPGSCHG